MSPGMVERPRSRGRSIAGWIVSGLCILFLLFDSALKLSQAPAAVEGTVRAGYQASVLVPLGIVLLVCTILYAVPVTAVWGALLLTAYLGGATATHVRAGQPFLFPVVFGVLVWAGLTLRNRRVEGLLFRRGDR